MPLITNNSSAITPNSNQGSQRPWRNLLRKPMKQPMPPSMSSSTTAPTGLPQMAATRSGTPGRKRDCN